MITVQVDDTQVVARLTSLPGRLRQLLLAKISTLAVQLAARVRQKLSGEVLNVRSGDLRASIFERVSSTSTSVAATVGSSGDVKYAAIHEYGGLIPAHDILPNKAEALAFVWQGKQQFFRRVHIPDVQMPERSYLRSSLAEMSGDIRTGLQAAVQQALDGK
jgi:phage gpG-like protein